LAEAVGALAALGALCILAERYYIARRKSRSLQSRKKEGVPTRTLYGKFFFFLYATLD
jgi:hypothetical protein